MANVILNGSIGVRCVLPNGVYYLGLQSATGKSYLRKLLKNYNKGGNNVNSFSYEDVDIIPPPVKGELVLFDRYDMYSDRFKDEILSISKNGVVLLDLKRESKCNIGMLKLARIVFDDKGNIEIK